MVALSDEHPSAKDSLQAGKNPKVAWGQDLTSVVTNSNSMGPQKRLSRKQTASLQTLASTEEEAKEATDSSHGHGHGEKAPSLITAAAAGIINWLLMFGLCCAYGMIMFNDPHNARHRGLGVKMNLSTAMLVGLLLALVSKVPVAIGGPDLNPVIFCASFVSVISRDIAEQLGIPNYPDTKRRLGFSLGDEIPGAGEILRQLGSGGSSDSGSTWCEGQEWASYQVLCEEYHEEVRATTIFAVAVSSAILGLLFFVLGKFRLTKFVSFVPTSVMEAFLSCVGYKVFYYALKFCKFKPIQFIPAAIVGVTMYFMKSMHIGNPAVVIPLLLLIPLMIFYVIIFSINGGDALDDSGVKKWMFPTVNNIAFYRIWADSLGKTNRINIKAWLKTLPDLGVMLIVCVIDCLLKVSSTENKLPVKVAKDYEVQLYGIGNIFTTIFGSSVGYMQLKFNVINYGVMGNAKDRRGSICYALLCAICFFWQIEQFNFLPRFFLGILLFFAGAGFVAENLWGSRLYLSLAEWCEILLILLVFIISGQLLYAVGAGILITCVSFILKYSKVSCVLGRPMRGGEMSSPERRDPIIKQNLQHITNAWLLIVRLKGYIFFASAQALTKRLQAVIEEEEKGQVPQYRRLHYIVLDCELLDGMDASASKAFKKLAADARSLHVKILWSAVTPEFVKTLKKRSIIQHDGDGFKSLEDALSFVEDRAIRYRNSLQDKWLMLHPAFRLQSNLNQSCEDFDPFQGILMRTARCGCPWKYCTSESIHQFTTILWQPGQLRKPLYLVHTGKVALFKSLPKDGEEWCSPHAIYSHGSFLNREALIQKPTRYYAIAIEDGEVLTWSEDQWYEMSRKRPTMSTQMFRAAMKQMSLENDAQVMAAEIDDVDADGGTEEHPEQMGKDSHAVSFVPEVVRLRIKGLEIAEALAASRLYERGPVNQSQKPVVLEMPTVLRQDALIAFQTFCTPINNVQVVPWETTREALLYAGITNASLLDKAHEPLDQGAFLQLCQEASVSGLSSAQAAMLSEAFQANCSSGEAVLNSSKLQEMLYKSLKIDLPVEEIDGIIDEWAGMQELSADRFIAVVARFMRLHEQDFNLLVAFRSLFGSNRELQSMHLKSEQLIEAAASRNMSLSVEDAEEVLWAANWRVQKNADKQCLEFCDAMAAILYPTAKPAGLLPPMPKISSKASRMSTPNGQTAGIDKLNSLLFDLTAGEGVVESASSALGAALNHAAKASEQRFVDTARDHGFTMEDNESDTAWQASAPDTFRAQLHVLIEEPSSSQAASILSLVMGVLILISIFTMFLEPLISPPSKIRADAEKMTWFCFELVLTVVFTIEFLTRLAVADALGKQTMKQFLKAPGNICDAVAIMPFYVENAINVDGAEFRLLRIVRLLRLTRIARLGRLAKKSALFGPVAMVLIVIWGIFLRTGVDK